MRLGIISDTHGLLRPEALGALRGCDSIVHTGDVGDAEILRQLRELAPVTAIRGNIDRSGACARLPATEAVEFGGKLLYLVHSIDDLDLDPVAAGMAAVISGHSHRASIAYKAGVLYLNPGSAGPRRFRLPVTVATLRLDADLLEPEIVSLLPDAAGVNG